VPAAEAKHGIDRGRRAQVIQLCLAPGKVLILVRELRVDHDRVHDAVGAGVRKRVQQHGIDEREHGRGGADAEREGDYGDSGEARVSAQSAQAIADVTT